MLGFIKLTMLTIAIGIFHPGTVTNYWKCTIIRNTRSNVLVKMGSPQGYKFETTAVGFGTVTDGFKKYRVVLPGIAKPDSTILFVKSGR